MVTKLLENSTVKVTTFIALTVFMLGTMGGLIGFAVSESAWRTNITRDIAEIKKQLSDDIQVLKKDITNLEEKIVGKGPHGFHLRDARMWALEIQQCNPEMKIPEPDNEFTEN